MRLSRTLFVATLSVIAALTFTSPASAAEAKIRNDITGDFTKYDTATKMLRVCDNSSANGTAMGMLEVIGGNTVTLFDNNGKPEPCGNDGPLGVDTTKSARLWICTTGSGPCVYSPIFPLSP